MTELPHRPELAGTDPAVGYAALIVPAEVRAQLKAILSQRYSDLKGDHITLHVGVTSPSDELDRLMNTFQGAEVEIIGVADDNYAVQCFLAKVNGAERDERDRPYHLTWSVDSQKPIPPGYDLDGAGGTIGSRHAAVVAGLKKYQNVWAKEDSIKFNARFRFLTSKNITQNVLTHKQSGAEL